MPTDREDHAGMLGLIEMPKFAWFKSSYSSSEPGDCVEVATTPATIHIRDSKTPDTPRLTVASTTWTRFVAHVSLL